MTDNHLLLSRLAERMLEHEQHILPVDILFDDEQIGDFVRSIQIDSPYQQMLLEGVLTETIVEERVHVRFAVEGYFHYILGQLIFTASADQPPTFYQRLLLTNSLVGLRGAIEQALINEVSASNLDRLMWLIDADEKFTDLVAFPILIYLKANYQSHESDAKGHKVRNGAITAFIKNLFRERSDRDYDVVYAVIKMAKKQGLQSIASVVAENIIRLLRYDSFKSVELIGKCLEFIGDRSVRLNAAKKISQWMVVHRPRGMKALELHSRLAMTFEYYSMYDEAERFYRKCLAFELRKFGRYHLFTSTSYNQLGLLKLKRLQTRQARVFFLKSLDIKQRLYEEANVEITNALHNIALSYQYDQAFEECIDQYEIVLVRRFKSEGRLSLDTAVTMSNLAICYIQSEIDLNRGETLLNEAFVINKQLLGNVNQPNNLLYRYFAFLEKIREGGSKQRVADFMKEGLSNTIALTGDNDLSVAYYYDDLCWVYLELDQQEEAKKCAEYALKIYKSRLGAGHGYVLNLERAIKENGL